MQMHRGNLFLVGMPGCGKSTLGRLLARRLDKRFYDADVELERRLGVSIPVIFELEGEHGFRDREEAVLTDLVTQTNIVLSTGGGVVLRPANRDRLKEGGTVLYLHATPDTLWERTRHSKHRPLLQAPDPFARVQELYAARDALYREVADFVIESDREQVNRLAHRLEQQLRAAARA
ncbi:MAG TPA: shikimate kinase [Casimicrobiaceae bacterium]|nr:shikimate kinase [Casimicrobiaceae bacterium]